MGVSSCGGGEALLCGATAMQEEGEREQDAGGESPEEVALVAGNAALAEDGGRSLPEGLDGGHGWADTGKGGGIEGWEIGLGVTTPEEKRGGDGLGDAGPW